MKIEKLKAENIKILKTIEITPEGNLIIISGKNGNGKSSAIDTIWLALKGLKGKKIETTDIIRRGEKKAFAEIDLGEYIVVRTFSNRGDRLKVVSKTGGKYGQSLLNELMGDLAKADLLFDPLQFIYLDGKEQIKILMKAVGLDYDALEKERKAIFDNRTDVNRFMRDVEAQLKEFNDLNFSNVPDTELSSSQLIEEIKTANNQIMENERKRDELKKFYDELIAKHNEAEELRKKIKELADKLESLEVELKSGKTKYTELKTEVAALRDPDIEALQNKLLNIEDTNKLVRNKQRFYQLKKKKDEALLKSEALTEQLISLDEKKKEALQNVNLPSGLYFDEEGLTLNGIPFKPGLVSTSEALKIGCAIAMIANPQLKVLRIQNGNALDEESLAELKMILEQNNWQAWVEYVSDSSEKGIYIENGEIVKTEIEEALQ